MKSVISFLLLLFAVTCLSAQNNFEQIIDVKHYYINVDISNFAEKSISAKTKLNLQITQDNVQTICLYLQGLRVDSITNSDYQIENFSHNDTVITINFASTIDKNQPFDLEIYYHGKPQKDVSGFGGFYFSGEYAFNMGCAFSDIPHNYGRVWFPCNDNFTDKAKYTTIITTQRGKTAISSGQCVEILEDTINNKTSFTWELTDEIPTYLHSVAVGDYYHYHTVYQGVEREIPVDIYGYPTDSVKIANAFYRLDTSLSAFEMMFGPYPWQRVGYVLVDFTSGAMEHVGNIAVGRLFVTSGLYETLYYHELAHQWFGNLVTCDTAEEMWLNEGFATYCETLWTEKVCGSEQAKNYRRNAHSNVIKKVHIEDSEYLPLSPNPVYNTYSSNVYQKGASVVHTLRHYLGDSVFFSAIKQYLQEFSFKNVNSQELCNFLTQATNVNMQDFFDTWVFTKGYLHYAIDSVEITTVNQNFDVNVFLRQKLMQRTNFANSNKVEICFMNADLSCETRIMQFDGEYGQQTFRLPFRPVLVMCDFYEKTADATIDYAKIITNIGNVTFQKTDFTLNVKSISDSAFVRVTCNFVAPDDFKQPIEGLRLVPSRYWLVEAIQHGELDAEMNFLFNSEDNSGWEKPFIQSADLDSLCLMYRKDKSQNWQVVDARYLKGSQKFRTSRFATGEYAIAVRDGFNFINESKESNFTIFPNPTKNMLTVQFAHYEDAEISVFDSNAKLMLQRKISDNSAVININNLPSGSYIMNVKTADWTENKVIVKQ